MAFYTPPSLPRTPSAYTMNASLPSLPTELIQSWSMWRHPKQDAPLTPPMTSTFESRKTLAPVLHPVLPPIAFLDRHISAMPPLTPPDDVPPRHYSPPPSTRLPPIQDHSYALSSQPTDDYIISKPSIPADAPYLVDWLDVSRTHNAHFIAEKTCEMICYLWFAMPPPQQDHSSNNSSPFVGRPTAATSNLQLLATPTFVQFMQKLLETTQVSQSVIVLSLHYIYRLKDRNRFTPAQAGSEFRIAVAGLMMANKFLDDNTYTNKTWSEVSGIDLAEINRMEREFLLGVNFNLYVDKSTYESWLNLLKGLVMAKERDTRQFRRSRHVARPPRHHNIHLHSSPRPSSSSSRYRTSSHRARSTSPQSRTSYASQAHAPTSYAPHSANAEDLPRSGAKRSAAAAFSPTSATFSHIPSKRPTSISLHIPEYRSGAATSNSSSHSPLESLQSFAKMSLASPHAPPPPPNWAPAARESMPETLMTGYTLDEQRRTAVPQNLYFYALACSPTESAEENRSRKSRLRYHQPPSPSSATQYYHHRLPPPIPAVQSASTSPSDVHINLAPPHPVLPHFHDTVWTRQPANTSINLHSSASPSGTTYLAPRPPNSQSHQQQQFGESPIPSAPFANAGPPGVQFYSYPTPAQRSYPLNSHQHNNDRTWSRSRPF